LTVGADGALIAALRAGLAELADPALAAPMQAYMKSSMPYHGVQTAPRRQLCARLFAAHPLDGFERWQATVLALWRQASHREERYCAIDLAGDRRYAAHQDLRTLPLYEELVVTGAWWDLVDPVATRRLGALLEGDPAAIGPVMRAWARDQDLWKRRSAILCQVRRKAATDLDLLYDCIEPNLAERSFWIRKAIGWALREYAKTDPAAVRSFVDAHRDRLSGLSVREALKNL
jgi:3-methyladenine DNA glycosylase AlkD